MKEMIGLSSGYTFQGIDQLEEDVFKKVVRSWLLENTESIVDSLWRCKEETKSREYKIKKVRIEALVGYEMN